MSDNLPPDLVAFLVSGEQLEYRANQCECGAVKLYSLSEVKLVEFRICSYGSEWEAEDPHRDSRNGRYIVPAFDLIAECEGYLPRGVLVYIPSLGAYGCHDDDHGKMRVFDKELSWTEIADYPTLYLNELWHPGDASELNPVGKFEFREDPARSTA